MSDWNLIWGAICHMMLMQWGTSFIYGCEGRDHVEASFKGSQAKEKEGEEIVHVSFGTFCRCFAWCSIPPPLHQCPFFVPFRGPKSSLPLHVTGLPARVLQVIPAVPRIDWLRGQNDLGPRLANLSHVIILPEVRRRSLRVPTFCGDLSSYPVPRPSGTWSST